MQNLSRDELVLLVTNIKNVDVKSEEELLELNQIFLDNVPDPEALDLIYDMRKGLDAPEEIVDKALSYKPIIL